MEIERKWVLPGPPPQIGATTPRALRQGYLALDGDVEVRLRDDDGALELTIKTGSGRSRGEHGFALDPEGFAELWPHTGDRQVVKERHVVDLGDGLVAEVDVYTGALAGLVTAEVEFPDEAAADAFVAPAWLGREVTGDGRYANKALARGERPPAG